MCDHFFPKGDMTSNENAIDAEQNCSGDHQKQRSGDILRSARQHDAPDCEQIVQPERKENIAEGNQQEPECSPALDRIPHIMQAITEGDHAHLASSASMAALNDANGCAPESRRPLMRKPGVPLIPADCPSTISLSTSAAVFGSVTHVSNFCMSKPMSFAHVF